MKIRTQIIISTVLLGSFLLLVSAAEIITNKWVQKLNRQEELAAQIQREAYELGYLANDYLHYYETQQADRWESKFASFSENLSNMQVNTPEQQGLLANIKANQQRLRAVFTEIRTSIENAPQGQPAAFDPNFMQLSWSRLEVQNQGLIFDASRLEGLLREQENRLKRASSLLSFMLVGVLGAFLLGNYGLIFRRTLRAIAELQSGTRIIGSGDLDFAIPVKHKDEFGELSLAFNQMTASLKEVTASKADLEREIAERTQAEEALRLSEKKFALAFANNPAAIALTRLDDGIFQEVNDTWLALSGYNRKEVIGSSARKLPFWPTTKAAERFVQELRENGALHWHEQEFRKRSGEMIVVQLSAQLLPIQGELMILSTLVDITERKRAEDALRASERRLIGVLESMPDAFVSFDTEMRYTYVNAHAERLQATGRENLIGKDVRVVYPDEESYKSISQYEWVLREQQPVTLTSYHAGFDKWVEIRAFPTPDGVSVFYKDVSTQAKTEDALRQSEARFRLALTHAPVSVATQDCDLVYTWAYNQKIRRPDEIVGKTDLDLFPAEATHLTELKRRVLATGENIREELWITSNHQRLYFDLFIEPLRDENGEIEGIGLATVDLTLLKLAEDSLRQNETLLQAVLDHVPDAIYLKDRDSRFLLANPAALAAIGKPAEAVLGKTDAEIYDDPATGRAIMENDRRIMSTGQMEVVEESVLRPEGTHVYLSTKAPYYDTEGQINGLIGTAHEITERVQVEQRIAAHAEELQWANSELHTARLAALNLMEDMLRAHDQLNEVNDRLRESEQRLKRAQEIAHLGSWELDLLENRLTWSDEVYRIFGLQPQQFAATYEAFLESIHPDDRAMVDQAYSSSIREGKDRYEIEHRVVKRSSGEIRVVHEKCEHFRDNAGKIIRSVGMVHDITERVLAQAALRESEGKYRTLFENMTEEVHFWQLVRNDSGQIQTWRLVDANPPTLKSWGQNSVEEIRGRTSDEILGPGAADHYMPVVQKIMTEGAAYSYEDYFPNLDKYFRFTSVPLGEYFITTGADITSLKKAHEALRAARDELEVRVQERTKELERTNMELLYEIYEREEAERQLHIQITAMEAAANGIIITDLEGTILWSNPALTRMTGYTGDELVGQNMRIFNSGQHDSDHYRQMWDTILAGDIWQGEMENRRKDGSLYTESQTIASVRSETGELSHFIAIKQDITEHKRMEAALELERIRLKNILDTIPDGVYIINQDYEIEYTNPVIEREFGPVGERKCYAYFHELSEPCPWCKNDEIFTGIVLIGERTYEKNNKSYEIFDAPFANSDGSMSKLKILHDITQRKKMELTLEQNNLELQAATDAERKQRHAAETLRAATQALAQSLDLDTVLNTLLNHVTALVETDIASVGFVEDETRLVSRVAQGHGRQTNIEPAPIFPIDAKTDLFFQQVAASHTSLFISDATQEPDWIDYPGKEPLRSWLGVPILVNEKVIGVVLLGKTQPDFFNPEHAQSAEALVSQASVAIQNAWLFEQVRAGRERLQLLSRRLVEVQESERRYIARELHDQAGQSLTSLILGLGQLEKGVAKNRVKQAQTGKLKLLASDILEDLHRLAVNLRPASLDHLGLVAALQQLGNTYMENEQLEVKFKALGFGEQDRFPAEVETTLYRIVQEALTNVTRHAQATHADVILEQRGDTIILIVEDNGIGFDTTFSPDNEHLGLIGIRERTEMLGGILTVESMIGSGTILVVEVPYADTHLAGR